MKITLQGNLNTFRLPEILRFVHDGRKTGTVNLVQEEKEVFIHLDEGKVVFASSNQQQFQLSAVLLRRGRITEEQKSEAESLMKSEKIQFGKAATQLELISEEELYDYLKIQVSEVLYDCSSWTDGLFSLLDVMQLPEYAVRIHVDLPNLMMEMVRRIDRPSYLNDQLPAGNSLLRPLGNPQEQRQIRLSLDEWRILFLLDGKRSLDQVEAESGKDDLGFRRVIYGMLMSRLIEVVPDKSYIPAAEKIREEGTPAVTRKEVVHDTGLLISSAAKHTYRDVLKVTLAILTLKGPNAGKTTFPLLEQEYRIGRKPGVEIQIPDPSVSNVHARIFKGPEGYVLEDLGSRNGTYVNGERIDRRLLHDHDALRIGSSRMSYSVVCEAREIPQPTSKPGAKR